MTDEEKLEADVKVIAEAIRNLNNKAYIEYRPWAENLILRAKSKNVPKEIEIRELMNYLFDFCGDNRLALLYRRICGAYYKIYPVTILDYVLQYFEEYEEDKYKEIMARMEQTESAL